jgi:Domain of unknown function (DUF4386)
MESSSIIGVSDAVVAIFHRCCPRGIGIFPTLSPPAAEIFWGLWLIPLAILVYRSRFLPRFLGVWLIANGLGYVINSFTGILLPNYAEAVNRFTFPALTGEVALVLWLLIKGAKDLKRCENPIQESV